MNWYCFKLLFFLILFQSCIETNSSGFQFKDYDELTSNSVNIVDSISFRYPFRVRQKDTTLYVLDLHGRQFYCFQLFYPNIANKKKFASKGNGPEEFLSVENIRLSSSGDIYLLDANKETISIYNTNEDSIKKEIKLPDELLRSLDFALINDSLFAIADYTGKCRINMVDINGKIQQKLFQIPTKKYKDVSYSKIVLAQAWRSFIDYNPGNGILAMATQLGQVIEIYDLKKNEIVNILFGKYGEPEFTNLESYAIPNGIMGYSDIQVGNDAIYTVFWGTPFKDIQRDPFNTLEGGDMIQVFSLTGIPLQQYHLDKHIVGFSVDEKNKKLTGLDVNNENQIVEYQL
jgi:hypothetical protein